MNKKIELEYRQKGSFNSNAMDGICHVKSLPYLSIAQAVEGDYDITLGEGETHSTGAGGFFIAPENVQQTIVHHADKASGSMTCRWVFLKIKLDDVYTFDNLYDFPVILPAVHRDALNAVFDELFATDDVFDEHVCYYKIIKILSLISQEKQQKPPAVLGDVLAYIKAHYQEKITVAELASSANLSPSYFFSVFKKAMGVSPVTYLNSYRLSLAAEMLVNSSASVSRISQAVGVEDSVYFNKLFRKAYQMSPSSYRLVYQGSK